MNRAKIGTELLRRAAVLAMSATAGCYGGRGEGAEGGETDGADDGDGDGDGDDDDDDDDASEDDGGVPGECDEEDGLSATHMRRLSKPEFENTIAALLEDFDAGEAAAIMEDLDSPLAQVPEDARESFGEAVVVGAVFDGMDHSTSQVHIDRYYDVARAFAREIVYDDARTTTFVGACATDADPGNDAACIEDFVASFGRRAMRRPLTDEEQAFFVQDVYADGGPVGEIEGRPLEDLIVAFLLAPQTLYHIEDGGDPAGDADEIVALTSHELASRLSYLVWMGPPDAELRAVADDGTLLESDVYAAQVERLLDDPRAEDAYDHFFAQWWGTEEVVDPFQSVGDPAYDAFAGAQSPSPELRDAMLAEVSAMTSHYLWEQDGTLQDLLTTDASFAESAELAGLYGVDTYSPGGTPPTFPDGERAGVLTRAAFLVNGSTRTRPVLKGKRVLEEILCQTIPPPPDNVNTDTNLEPPFTTRERLEAMTEQEGTSCVECHQQLNPFGYALEAYDALGRYRTEEVVFDEAGNELGSLPVDTSTELVVAGQMQAVSGAVELSNLLADDERVHACFARHLFRFTYNRPENPGEDLCLIEDAATRVADGDSLRSIVRSTAMSPTFRLRNLED